MKRFIIMNLIALISVTAKAQENKTIKEILKNECNSVEIKSHTLVSQQVSFGSMYFYVINDSLSIDISREQYIECLMLIDNLAHINIPVYNNLEYNLLNSIIVKHAQNGSCKKLTLTIAENFEYNKLLSEVDFSLLKSINEIVIINDTKSELIIPQSIFDLKNLKIIKITNSNLKTIDTKISNLKRLEILNLEKNQLTTLPDEFGDLKNLKVLNLQNNHFYEIPKSISKLKKLQSLNISENGLNSVTEDLYNLKKLMYLKLSNSSYALPINRNKIEVLPNGISKLSKLRFLNLAGNPIVSMPDDFDKLTCLEYLNLNKSQNPSFLNDYKFSQLDTLILSNSNIDSIPINIREYEDLKVLDVENSNLVYISDNINYLQNLNILSLKKIYVSKEEVERIIQSDIQYKYSKKEKYSFDFAKQYPAIVESIKLSYKDIKDLEDKIYDFTNLKKIEVVNIRMNEDDSSFVSSIDLNEFFRKLSTLDNLQEFKYYYSDWYNKAYKIDLTGIKQLKKMKSLELAHMELNEFPEEICELINLERLDLSFNKLKTIPAELSNLKQLRYLDLRRNCLIVIPISICKLDKLEYIDFRNNNIKIIPVELAKLNNLKKVYLYNIRNRDGYDASCLNEIENISPKLNKLVTNKILVTD